jgi:hypothetical protein
MLQEWQEVARDETNWYKARQSLLGQQQSQLLFQNVATDTLRRMWNAPKPQQQQRDPNMMDIDAMDIQAQQTYPLPQL